MKLVLLFVCFFSVYTEGQQFGRIVRNVNTNIFSSLVEKNKDSNVVISPLSIGIALSMLYEGTGGRTREQLKTALRFPDPTSIQEDVSGLVDEYENNATNITLRMGNGVFLTGDITPKQQFLDTVVSMYRGEVAELFNILQSYFSFHVPRRSSRTLQYLTELF
ncbi:thyroxine-binding globulin [Eurytemora carolleeae]|uniref:thyroxine-binding globulin n=1 Tax=Eurytemora carolleeae TaxID=1294199 RepID=UPI000C7917FC|nr:thyroxine-binding globulin [Eurytemora carolleeae]|eukprot:XP_023325620.1 thyroxine-binding globulin-like [Eurytemora affinis]